MTLSPHQQLYETIQRSQNPLIVFQADHNGDMIASSLALGQTLNKLAKNVEIVGPNFKFPETHKFLETINNQQLTISNQLNSFRKLTITLNSQETERPQIEHQNEGRKIHIHITPMNGRFSKENISISESNFKHDLIICLNTPDLDTLADLYEKNTDFFYHVPIINIDHCPENEHYGQLNIVDLTATSVAEIIYEMIDQIDPHLFDEKIATCLLAGMIEKTRSFKLPSITPKTLNIASQLIAAGADRETIIKNLYQTRTVNALKLWGRILLNLNNDFYQKICWAEITEQDFQETNCSAKDLNGVVEELIANIPTVELTALFYQNSDQKYCLIKSEKGLDLRSIFRDKQPEGTKNQIKLRLTEEPRQILEKLHELI